jgi:hypothetical protein
MIFPFKETNFPTISFNTDRRKKYKFITDKHFEPITIRANSTNDAIHTFLKIGFIVDDILAIECYK